MEEGTVYVGPDTTYDREKAPYKSSLSWFRVFQFWKKLGHDRRHYAYCMDGMTQVLRNKV